MESFSSKPIFIDEEHCVRSLNNVIVTFTKAPPSPSYLRAWAAEADAIVGRCGDLVAYTVISRVAAAPSEEAKAEIRKVMTRHEARIQGVAYAVEGAGFSAAAMRSALTLISLVARYPYPQKIFSTVSESSTWIAGLGRADGAKGPSITAPQLDALVGSMRAEHERRSAKAG